MTKIQKKKQRILAFRRQKSKDHNSRHESYGLTGKELKTKSISVPQQSILKEYLSKEAADNELVLRKLSLVKHPSGLQRKEALNTLKDLLRKSEFETKIWTLIIKTTIPLMIDEESGVRGALRSLLLTIFTEKEELIEPHILFMILYIHSAMTHILPDVRNDSTKILAWLLEIQGECVVKYAWEKFLNTFSVLFGWKNEENTANTAKTVLLFKPTFSQESRYQHFKAFDIFLKKGLYSNKENDHVIPNIYINQTRYLSGINHPMVSKYLGRPLKSSPYFHLSLFSQVNNISKKVYKDVWSRLMLFYSYLPGLLSYLQGTWFELLPSSMDSLSFITIKTCILIISILDHINLVLKKVKVDDSLFEQNLKIFHDFIARIEYTMQEFKNNNESVELWKYWVKTGLHKK
ncbi:hypothetical protein T552_01031 [Pneumocystis carinii B80]|uniref:Pre-rRNA-processing protein n=1 Tax=Pneumocystis carinii (strain B80) TaxID=1408658 RepID=A0A0W4ZN79_PNEC8|nr:hypothetical protein T552_01031 [Pneumocystis carinii B80]KTW29827.1 hypothetical protein T552_01031 [Pneumocystis carinii B80]